LITAFPLLSFLCAPLLTLNQLMFLGMIVPAAMGKVTQPPPAKYGPGDDPDVNDTVLDPKGGLIFIKGGSKQW
jgi:hypothetical protein